MNSIKHASIYLQEQEKKKSGKAGSFQNILREICKIVTNMDTNIPFFHDIPK